MATGTSSYINGALCKHLCPTNDTRFRLGPPAARTFYVYSCLIANHSLRSFLARLRGGTAPLAIETGHYVGVPKEERTCHNYYEWVEDEFPYIPHANVQNCKGRFYMSIFKRVTLSFTISLTRCILHHANSSNKTAELIYNIFMPRKCVNL